MFILNYILLLLLLICRFSVDLETEKGIAQIQHDLKVNWLELNETAKYLLFRDIKMKVANLKLI